MKIAIIGSGISGLVAAYRLRESHDITLFEANDYIGGHTNTVDVDFQGDRQTIDTGFIVFNDRTYPNFEKLLDELGIESVPTSMSFSVSCSRSGLEYNGSSLNGLFAQRLNLARPRFYRMLGDILRFNRSAPRHLYEGEIDAMTVGDYLRLHGYGEEFTQYYLLPMGAAIWSCPTGTFADFPIRFVIEFYEHHGLLSLKNRPQWRTIQGGSRSYVEAMTESFRHRIRLQTPIEQVRRGHEYVELAYGPGRRERFDEVIFACHSDQALRILADPSPVERELLGAFPYSDSVAVLHTDESVLPQHKRAWASWNYHLRTDQAESATVTYNMNELQHLLSPHIYCVTLNETDRIDPKKVIRRIRYSHPIFTINRRAAQGRHPEVIRQNRTSFCGAYWGNGFHEDGVRSALAVCSAFEQQSRNITDRPATEFFAQAEAV